MWITSRWRRFLSTTRPQRGLPLPTENLRFLRCSYTQLSTYEGAYPPISRGYPQFMWKKPTMEPKWVALKTCERTRWLRNISFPLYVHNVENSLGSISIWIFAMNPVRGARADEMTNMNRRWMPKIIACWLWYVHARLANSVFKRRASALIPQFVQLVGSAPVMMARSKRMPVHRLTGWHARERCSATAA